MNDSGILRISSEADRVTVASILYKNGYSVTPARIRTGKKIEKCLQYEQPNQRKTFEEAAI